MGNFQIGALVDENSLILILVSTVIGITFLFMQPFIKWLVRLRAIKLISYINCSMFALLVSSLIALFISDINHVNFLKITLQGVAIFGGVLFLLYSIHYLLKGKQKQKSV